jgi:hypothetical protein
MTDHTASVIATLRRALAEDLERPEAAVAGFRAAIAARIRELEAEAADDGGNAADRRRDYWLAA